MQVKYPFLIVLIAFLGASSEGSVQSRYTPVIDGIIKTWPRASLNVPRGDEREVQIRVFDTPGNKDYIGTELQMEIGAELSDVERVVNQIENYQKLLPGFEEIKRVQGNKNQFDVFWEKTIPVFFIENIKYTVSYVLDSPSPNRRLYRGQLKEEAGLKALDSVLVLEKVANKTKYYECAFFEGNFGLISSLAPSKIWRDSVEAVLHAALAKKMKAETPDTTFDAVMERVSAEVKTYPIEELVEKRKPFREREG